MKRCDCQGGPRPCPLVTCRYHLLFDVFGSVVRWHEAAVQATGRHMRDWSEDDVVAALSAMTDTCALDVADRGPHTTDEVGAALGFSGEFVRQIEDRALRALRYTGRMRELAGKRSGWAETDGNERQLTLGETTR